MATKNYTSEEAAKIRKDVRAANRRLERASEGQRRALEYYVQQATGEKKFSAAIAGKSKEEISQLQKALDRFLSSSYSTKKGWKETKEKQVASANKTLTGQGYGLTDDELAEILMEIDSQDKKDFYRAVNLVQAEKEKQGDLWKGTSEQIREAIKQKKTAQEALENVLELRKQKGTNKKNV